MRAFASYLTGLGLLASLMFVGGAWSSPQSTTQLESVDVHPNHVLASFDEIERLIADPVVAEEIRTLPPGCSIPNSASTCAPTVVAGGLTFPSEDAADAGRVAEAPVEPDVAPLAAAESIPAPEPAPAPPVASSPVAPAPTAAPEPVAPVPAPLAPKNVEGWRTLVAAYFAPGDVELALRVIGCESSGDPNAKNPTSSASGLFQHLGRFWPERSVKAGWAGADIFDPTANTAVAAWLVYHGGGWSHWNPSRHCWG